MPRFLVMFQALVLALVAIPAAAQQRDGAKVFFFGNSLINHASETEETTVPYWLAELARADDARFAADGTWGFLRDFMRLPPEPKWGFSNLPGVWNSDRTDFAAAGFDSVVINPANFIQYAAPDQPFDGDNPDQISPLAAIGTVFDWTTAQSPDMRLFVYEGWPDMGGFSNRFPPRNRPLRRYHAYAADEYHEWYVSLVEHLRTQRPDMQIGLIPVSSLLTEIMTGPLAELEATDFYTDNAPHGTPTTYFLAALVTYAALYDRPPPVISPLPAGIHPAIESHYADITARISNRLGVTVKKTKATPIDERNGPPGIGLDNPSLAMGLNGIADWSTQHPFIDIMKTARPWTGHLRGQWGGFDAERMEAEGYLDNHGWPLSIPNEVTKIESFLLTDMPEQAISLAGSYLVTFKGKGDLRVTGRADNTRYNYREGWITFDYEPGDGPVSLTLTKTDPENHIRDIVIIRQDHLALYQAGAVFNPDWIARIRDMRVVRFMDWMFTNGSPQRTWPDRPRQDDYTYVRRGVPIELMVRLANEIGADPWFCLPHMADDEYIRAFAEITKTTLDPRLLAHVEYSNELWNMAFPQTQWALEQAEGLWPGQQDGWIQFAGMRAAQVALIWSDVFGTDADKRLRNVVSVHTGWPGLEEAQLTAPNWLAGEGKARPPYAVFDAYAVTGYFGFDLGSAEGYAQIEKWRTASRAIAVASAAEKGLTGTQAEAFITANSDALAFDLAAAALANGSLAELTGELFPFHAKAAQSYGLDLIMYEGGTHVAGHGDLVNNDDATDFYTRFNYSDQMGQLYGDLITAWHEVGGTQFNAFVDVAAPSKWGSWGALRYLSDDTPRWDALMQANTKPNASERQPGAFLHGMQHKGTNSDDVLEGTVEEDILLGQDGNDLLLGQGGSDMLHGGAGTDRAILPGGREDYSFRRDGDRIIAARQADITTLYSVEEIGFSDTPNQRVSVDALF